MQGSIHLQGNSEWKVSLVCTGEHRGEVWYERTEDMGLLVGPAMASNGAMADVWSVTSVGTGVQPWLYGVILLLAVVWLKFRVQQLMRANLEQATNYCCSGTCSQRCD